MSARTSRRERLCCVLCYALLLTLGWLLLTGNPYPLAIVLVASFAAAYSADTATAKPLPPPSTH